MNWTLSVDEQTIVAQIADLARERFAPRAAQYDAENRFTSENYADLREHQLLGLTIPKEYGGRGLSSLAYSLAMREMAKGDASTALSFNMHTTIMTILSLFATEEQKRRYFADVISQGALFSSLGSEPAGSPNSPRFYVETSLTKTADGYRLNGEKHFCSIGAAAAYYFAFAMIDGTTGPREGLVSVIVPKGTPGMTLNETWNSMSMRATASDSISFRDCLVTDEHIIGSPGAVFISGVGSEYVLGYAAIYLGIAEAAYEFARAYARTRIVKPDTRPIGHNPLMQRYIGEMSVSLEAARLMSLQAAATARPGVSERIFALQQAKYFSVETAMKVTDIALRVCGGRGLLKDFPLERYYRDVRAGVVMFPSTDFLLLQIGRTELGLNNPG